MADEHIEIEDLPSTILPGRQHRIPAMLDGQTVYLTIAQIIGLITSDDVEGLSEVLQSAVLYAEQTKTEEEQTQARENINAAKEGTGQKLGTIEIVDHNYLPAGWLRYGEGGTYDTVLYPEFTVWMGVAHPELAAGVLPNYLDYSPRIAGGALGPAVGETQEDAGQRITGTFGNVIGATESGAFELGPNAGLFAGAGSNYGNRPVSFDSGNSPGARVSDDETRVKSFGIRLIIRARTEPVTDTGVLDIEALESGLNALNPRVEALENIDKPFTKEYVSAEQVITSGGSLSLSHGMGATPKILVIELVCLTAEFGYSVGDVLDYGGFNTSSTSNVAWGVAATKTASEIDIRYSSYSAVFGVFRKDTGVAANLTNANWRLIVRAWA